MFNRDHYRTEVTLIMLNIYIFGVFFSSLLMCVSIYLPALEVFQKLYFSVLANELSRVRICSNLNPLERKCVNIQRSRVQNAF